MNRGELLPGLESWLRQSWARPDLVIDSVRPPNQVSSELTEPWRAEKFSGGQPGDIEGLVPLDLVVRTEPDSGPEILAVMLKARTGAGVGRTLLPQLFEQAQARGDQPRALPVVLRHQDQARVCLPDDAIGPSTARPLQLNTSVQCMDVGSG